MGDRARDRAEHRIDQASEIYAAHGRLFRTMWVAVGAIVVVAGLAMIIVPGPATVVVPLGLAMLAAVFGWARRLLVRSIEVGEDASERFRQARPLVKALTVAASVSVAAGVTFWIWS